MFASTVKPSSVILSHMRRAEYVRFTREELYELVWSKPMTEIADDFGMSSVAFAKYCKAADVPRPERGYWQQVENGGRPKKMRLHRPRKGAANELTIPKYQRRAPRERVEVPTVTVADHATTHHPVVRSIRQALRRPDGAESDALRGSGRAVLSVSSKTKARAFRIFDALFHALEQRGHSVVFTTVSENPLRYDLKVVVEGKPSVSVWLTEHISRSDHVMTEKEKADKARYGWSFATKYDYAPSGRLIVEIGRPWRPEGMQRRWSDGKTRLVEEQLGEVVVGIEQSAEAWRVIEEDRARERREHEDTQKRADEERERAEYFRALRRDLTLMAQNWDAAAKIRSFLGAVEEAVPVSDRGDAFRKWLTWADAEADALDPLTAPYLIARDVEPDAAQIQELLQRLARTSTHPR